MVSILRLVGTAENTLSGLGVVDVRLSYTPPGGGRPCTGTLEYLGWTVHLPAETHISNMSSSPAQYRWPLCLRYVIKNTEYKKLNRISWAVSDRHPRRRPASWWKWASRLFSQQTRFSGSHRGGLSLCVIPHRSGSCVDRPGPLSFVHTACPQTQEQTHNPQCTSCLSEAPRSAPRRCT